MAAAQNQLPLASLYSDAEEDPEILREQETRLEALSVILKMQPAGGRMYLWRVLEDARVFDSTFHRDPHQAAFNEGMRALGVKIMQDIQQVDGGRSWLAMIGEANRGRR